MSKEGKGRNQIVYELALEHVKVSSGSVSNILNEDKNTKSQIKDSTINTKVDINTSGPTARIGDGKATIRSDSNGNGLIMSPLDIVNDLKEIDFADTAYRDFYPYLEVDASQKVINAPLDSTKIESEAIDGILSSKEIEESQTKNSLFAVNNDLRFESSRETLAGAWSYMHQRARKFKDKIRHETLVLSRREQRLQEQTIQLEREKQDFVVRERDLLVRESVVSEAEPLLPLVHQFQNMGLHFDLVLPYIEYMRCQARKGIDPKTTATYIVHVIESLYKLEGLQKELDLAQKRLEMLKTATAQRERGLNMLVELENKGVSLDVIYELSRVLDLQKIAKELSARTDPWSNINNISVST